MYAPLKAKNKVKLQKNHRKRKAIAKNRFIPLPDPQEGKQQQFYESKAEVVVYGGAAGSGKAQRATAYGWALQNIKQFTGANFDRIKDVVPKEILELDNKVLMWDGQWKYFSEITAGDRIMNPDGNHQEVLQVHDRGYQQLYKFTFEDNTSVEVAGDHLWGFWEARGNSRRKTVTGYKEIYSNQDPVSWNKNYISFARVRDSKWLWEKVNQGKRFIIPVNAPLQFTAINRTKAERMYVYGVLLGDGSLKTRTNGGILFTSMDDEIIKRVSETATIKLRRLVPCKSFENKNVSHCFLTDNWVYTWARNHNLLGTKSHNKFIPKTYLRATLEARFALAQGLFDTDGYAAKDKREVSYTTVSQELAEDVATLVRSLGYMAAIRSKVPTYTYNGEKKEGQLAYTVNVFGHDLDKLFYLKRKRDRCNKSPNGGRGWLGKRIVSVEKTVKDYCRCITVANPNHLYITDDFTVTHNSLGVLLDAAKPEYLEDPDYRAVIFRRTYPEIKNPGGILDDSEKYYYGIKGKLTLNPLEWKFETGAKVAFRHIQHDKTVYEYQGAQIGRIYFDELTHFTEDMFFYMLSRNRSNSTVPNVVRATCNPDSESWVAKFIDWYIGEDGFPIEERGGQIRVFARVKGEIVWANTKDEIRAMFPHMDEEELIPKTFTFIPAKLEDNPILQKNDPSYKANLLAQHPVEMQRLLKGNWKVKYEEGTIFDRTWFEVIDALPEHDDKIEVRFWDLAATAKEIAKKTSYYTAGCRGLKIPGDENTYVIDLITEQRSPGKTAELLISTAQQDGITVKLCWELEGGSAGLILEESLTEKLKEAVYGLNAEAQKPMGDKVTRALPAANAASQGKVKLLRAPWNNIFLTSVASFDGSKKPLVNDVVDAFDGLYKVLTDYKIFDNKDNVGTKTREDKTKIAIRNSQSQNEGFSVASRSKRSSRPRSPRRR